MSRLSSLVGTTRAAVLTVAFLGVAGSGCSSGGGDATGGAGSGGETLPSWLATGPHSFPQNKASGACTLTSAAGASATVQSVYTNWKAAFVTSSGAPSGAMRVVDPQSVRCGSSNVASATVSEGMGYGMLAAVYMADRTTFDGLLAYVNAHLDAKGLMNWCIDSGGNTLGMGSATDADEDIAWSVIMAASQWSSGSYYATGKSMINAMYGSELAGDGTLGIGDNGSGTMVYPDYFSPAYYRVFAKVTSANWGSIVIDRNYTILSAVSGTDGLVPNSANTSSLSATGTYGYDSCRAPWRIALDYCFNGEQRAKDYLDKIGGFFNTVGAANICDSYDTATGNQGSSCNHNMAFIGPAGVAGMAGWPTLLDGAFSFGTSSAGDSAYFTNSLRVVTMLVMSGNFLDYSQQ